MLTIGEAKLGRREFLRAGSLALGGLSLADLLAARAAAAQAGRGVKPKSVIFLFMQGGPSQFETFDPKMDAPLGVRTATGAISTRLPDVMFGDTYKKLANLADRLTIVRSYQPGDAKHDIKPIVSTNSLKANLSSIYSRVAGTTNPLTGMPRSALLGPPSVDPQAEAIIKNFGNFAETGSLGASYAPFIPGAGGQLQESMQLSMPRERLDDRRGLLKHLDTIKRSVDAGGLVDGMDRFQEQAFKTILAGAADALDLSKEDPRVVERYDTANLVRPSQIKSQYKNFRHYVDHGRSLGKLLLLARRLCEAGCGFVTITTSFVWDNHADVNNVGVVDGMQYCGLPFDHAVSTFIEDVRDRGLSDDILLVCTGEIGRTPKINARGGRDHWGSLAPLLLSGGGLPMGHVIGQSTRDGGEPATQPVTIPNLISTIMNTLLDIPQVRLLRDLPVDVQRMLTDVEPIRELVS